MAPRRSAADLLHFWFYELGPGDWFGPAPWVDAALERRFGRWLAALRNRPASDFLTDSATARAAILLFDQVPRNVYRGTSLAFTTDPLARTLAFEALRRGWHRGLETAGRQFLAMPLMHSENIADQRASVAYFTSLNDAEILRFVRSHHRMIERFGRFPHRNAALGRRSTAEELEWIATPGTGF